MVGYKFPVGGLWQSCEENGSHSTIRGPVLYGVPRTTLLKLQIIQVVGVRRTYGWL